MNNTAPARRDGREKAESLSGFARLASATAHTSGKPGTFALCCLVVIVWAVSGPIFHYSDTWQLVINTGTTIVTFLMVFLIQNTQNRDGAALQAKLDELIRVTKEARNDYVGIEKKSEDKIEELREDCTTEAGAPSSS
ncbi:MAG: low affinity iron permease family protein [Rhizomicrobium sp.]|jgi:low affinity Fe/Cu permease